MSKRNSIRIEAFKVTVEYNPSSKMGHVMNITIPEPSDDDLVSIIAECSTLLNHKRRARDAKGTA